MFAHLFTACVQVGKSLEFPDQFNELLLPNISGRHGFKSIYMMKAAEQDKFVVVTFWETEADAQANVDYCLRERLSKMAHLLADQPTIETLEVVLRA